MSKKRNVSQFVDSVYDWMKWYDYHFDRLYELAISIFKYENVPDSVDIAYVERKLFYHPSVIWFKDDFVGENGSVICLPATLGGKLSVYDVPLLRQAYASNGYNTKRTDKNSVVMYNNMARRNTANAIRLYARELTHIRMTMLVNVNAQKTPVLLVGSEQQQLTLKNLYMNYSGCQPVIFGDSGLNTDSLKVLKTDAPYTADKLYQLYNQVWNEALTYLGISNVNIQKKERMITDEVMRSQGGTIASRYSRLNARREALEKVNKMFGTNITVDYADDFREADDEVMLKGDSSDGTAIDMITDFRTR